MGKPCPGSKMKGTFAWAKPRACSTMPWRPSGETMPSVASGASAMRFRWEKDMAPGWNAVIWLSSMSVVMKACAVNWSSSLRMWRDEIDSPSRRRA